MSAIGETPVPREARPYQGRRAGLVTRLIAAAVDLAVVAVVLVAAYAGWAAFLLLIDPRTFTFPEVSVVFSLLAWFVVSVGYLTLAWTLSGRSYGDLVMGLRVLGPGGRRLHLVGAFVRALACVVIPIGLLWVAVSRQQRSFQDVVLRTSVVYDWQPRTAHTSKAQPVEPAP